MAKGKEAPKNEYADRFPGAEPLHGSGDMYQWTKIGQELVGEFLSCEPYKNGHIARVLTPDGGSVSFSAPTLLAGALAGVKKGQKIAIVYSGEKPNEDTTLNPTKLFEVYRLRAGR